MTLQRGLESRIVAGHGCVALAVLAACSDSAGRMTSPPPPPPPEVVVATSAASTADCPYGGTIVRSGIDDNHNGVLDDSEASTRTVLCNAQPAQPPARIVIRLVAEPPGTACAQGGTAVQSGPDRNGNGALDDDEVSHTDFVCGELLLTRFTPEPPGANCIGGGLAFQVGRDRNHDGALNDDEVERTDFTCGDVVARSLTIASADDAAALAHIRIIHGSLSTVGAAVTQLSLPELEQVDGFLDLSGANAATRISLPALRDVASSLSITNDPSLVSVELPALSQVGSDFTVSHNLGLTDLGAMNVFAAVGRDVMILDDPALTAVKLPALVGQDIDVEHDAALAALDVLGGTRIGRLTVHDTGVTALRISTDTLRGDAELGDTDISDNPALASISIFTDHVGRLAIAGNPRLQQVSVLASVFDGDMIASNDPQLGSLIIDNEAEIGGAVAFNGSLSVSAPITGPIAFGPFTVAGDLTLEGTQLVDVLDLRRVGGTLRLDHNPRFTGQGTDVTLGGGVEIVGNDALTVALLSTQDTINGSVIVTDNLALKNVEMLAWVHAVHGDVRIEDNPSLVATLANPAVIDGELDVGGNPALIELGFEGLESAKAVDIANNAALPEVSFPALSGRFNLDVTIDTNPAVRHLQLPALTLAGFISIRHNHALPSCEVAAVFTRITATLLDQSDNDDATACTP